MSSVLQGSDASEREHRGQAQQARRGLPAKANGSSAVAALLRLQRSAGNQAVNQLLRRYAIQRAAAAPGTSAPEPTRGDLVQRALMREPSDSDTDPGPATSATPDGAGGASAGGTLRANKIVSDGALEIDAAQVTINAAMTQTSGVMQASTVVTDTVVAQTYTPGAGNVM